MTCAHCKMACQSETGDCYYCGYLTSYRASITVPRKWLNTLRTIGKYTLGAIAWIAFLVYLSLVFAYVYSVWDIIGVG